LRTKATAVQKCDARMIYNVRALIDFDSTYDIYHASKIFTGLCGLAHIGRIGLQIDSRIHRRGVDPLVVNLEVRESKGGNRRRLAVDLHDRSDWYAERSLTNCDVYFKRSYEQDTLDHLPEPLRRKISPFGLNHSCMSFPASVRLLPRLCALLLYRSVQKFFGSGARPSRRESLRAYLRLLTLASCRDYEQAPCVAASPAIIYQTRVWGPEDDIADDPTVNATRVELVRALRCAFGERFCGGLIPTPYALKRYPELIVKTNFRRSQYAAMNRRAFIGVYTRGLHHSNAFKLSEYLAASLCIVAEPPRHEIPVPLVAGRNYLAFRDPDECVGRCSALLKDADQAMEMRRQNHRYYRSNVCPTSHMMQLFDRAFGRWSAEPCALAPTNVASPSPKNAS
jgi:hypothetical protein